jgi:peptidoglycan hydrolase FlgJ
MQVQGNFAGAHAGEAQQPENPRLKAAAHEFEASMMKEFLKPLEHDSLFAEDEPGQGDGEEGSANALMSFGSQAMATAISERGGFGIATLILNHFQPHSGRAHATGTLVAAGPEITKVITPAADERK